MRDEDGSGEELDRGSSEELDSASDQRPDLPSDSDMDAIWAEIVASFDKSPDDASPRWPAAEDVDASPSVPARVIRPVLGEDPLGLFRAPVRPRPPADANPEAAEGHFVPPPPPPLPRGDAISRAAWAGVLGGPAYLLVAAIADWYIPSWLGALAVGGFVGGFITLVARMRERDPYDPDDGAVV